MPTVTAFLDDLRTAFGAECINRSIKAGMVGKPVFYAEEGGQTLGCAGTLVVSDGYRFTPERLADMQAEVEANKMPKGRRA